MADCCNCFSFTDDGDSFESWQGLRGPYYTPHVGADGVLSWTNTGNLPNPAPVDISGPPGPGVDLRGPVASVADLPATAPSGELWLVGAASPYEGYFYNGGSWEDLGQIAVGPEGPEGPTGPQGETGATGPAGPGVPSGGKNRQVLKKQSNTDYDTSWQDDNLGITGASPNDLVRIVGVDGYGYPLVFGRISNPNANVGIVQNGNTATQNISKGQYVIWNGALYTASAAIASGDTLSDSNLTVVTGGGLNALLAEKGTIKTPFEITANTDLNNLLVAGVYYSPLGSVSTTLLNYPGAAVAFSMFCLKALGGSVSLQIIFTDEKVYIRRYGNGIWNNWRSYTGTIVQ